MAGLLREQGQAALHITYDPDEALAIADRVIVLGQGQILDDGTHAQVYHSPRSLGSAQALGRLNILPVGWLARGKSGVAVCRWEDVEPGSQNVPGVLAKMERTLTLRGNALAVYRAGNERIIAPQYGEVGQEFYLGSPRTQYFSSDGQG